MKFRSLLFQEFRISKKTILLQAGLFLGWVALGWAMLLSAEANALGDEDLQAVSRVLVLMTAMIGSMSFLVDESFKSYLSSGWLNYSYALPITPFERAAARFVRRCCVVAAFLLLSLANAALLRLYVSAPFDANTIVWHIVIFSAMLVGSLPNELFVLRARSGAELKKMQTLSGLTMTAMMALIVLVVFKVGGIGLEELADSEMSVSLPVFSSVSFLWAVPLLLAAMAASFFAAYFSLGFAYPNAKMPQKAQKTENPSRAALPPKTDGTTGLLYKELKQNRLAIVLASVAPILLTAFPFCFTAIGAITEKAGGGEVFAMATNPIIRGLMFVIGIFVLSGLMSEAFKGDDKKLWAYFVVTTPQGVRAFLYRKYVIVLMMNLLYMIGGCFADSLLATLNYFVTGEEITSTLSAFYIFGVYGMLLIGAFDIPFTVRYGAKKGSIVKMTAMLLLCTAGVVVFDFLPGALKDALVDTVEAVMNGEANDALMLILSLFPFAALAAFLYSHKISCKIFMKGVNEYD